MSLTKPYRRHLIALLAVSCLGVEASAAEDAAPESDKGRYTMSTTPDGVIRLDTRTGAVSTCNNSAGGWACYAVPDERAALDAEIGRLQAENEKLKVQLASRDQSISGKIDEPLPKDQALPKSDQLKKAEPKIGDKAGEKPGESKSADGARKIEIPLPSDQDMDRMMGFLEQAWRRLLDMAQRVQKDVSGKI
ncbi:hypothetical protein SSBR45G_57710 [Bradyrhizobium sp. SSBR45G]|uniref:hypothetical protein n=1 Tax=unclassified Bradyrhizobium TaxID=2631580 RepID=UPI002342918E|nr:MULTISPECIES: hypothetical protein [unclassified Bradyrhizobium]GLH80862.1 hypothetical protein SSBR45G_57710 [Bradyrhizobium sp. SSBR45G]GLH88334.1 hypothetical protein SSBR45R_57950 [Bradyrhizobium sp. SSBR45R]